MAAVVAVSHLNVKLSTSINSLLSSSHHPSRPSHHRPIVAATNQSYWSTIDTYIDTHLKNSITIRHPTCVFEPMHHLTFSASKTTAPALCVAACELVGGSAEEAVPAASAIHLMHAAAFTHQHLQFTDGPGEAHGVKHIYNPNIELLTPDGMVPFGFELLGRSELARTNSDRILRVIIEISRAIGSQGLVDKMYRETMQANDEEKQGELHACAGACGAILGGGSEEEIEKLRKYGQYVGMIQNIIGKSKQGRFEIVSKLKEMAIKELEIFNGGQRVDQISTLLDEIY